MSSFEKLDNATYHIRIISVFVVFSNVVAAATPGHTSHHGKALLQCQFS